MRRVLLATVFGSFALLAGCGSGTPGSSSTGGGGGSSPPSTPTSSWVYYDANGHLAYKQYGSNGDRIMDFSSAGYGGGGVALPAAAVAATVLRAVLTIRPRFRTRSTPFPRCRWIGARICAARCCC